mgnify:FL=1
MKAKEFREELVKIMPGYKWTVHRSSDPKLYLRATGVQSKGMNRMSTLQIERREINGIEYIAKIAGYGTHSDWISTNTDRTLARALRGLQNHCETMAREYGNTASTLQDARKKPDKYGSR